MRITSLTSGRLCAVWAIALCSCTPAAVESHDPGDDTAAGDPLWGTPHTLDPLHLDWKNPNCSVCKDQLPRANHTAENPWECAECHGGNGACNPNGAYVPRTPPHDPAVDLCITCHGNNHGFAQSPQCVSCHFADTAVVDCRTGPADDGGPQGDPGAGGDPGGDPTPGDASGIDLATLEDNCFNFPTQPFSPANNSGGNSLNVSPGQLAYEFTLNEIDGNSHTLSTLLASRPVLLVFGAYT